MQMIRSETGRLPRDPLPDLSRNALVSTAWLAARAGSDRFVVIECSSNPDAYASTYIPGAHELDWRRDLDSGDLIRGDQFAALAPAWASPRTTTSSSTAASVNAPATHRSSSPNSSASSTS